MSIARVKVWIANEVLTAADLNAEFNNILNSPVALWSPAAAAANMNGNALNFDTDNNTGFVSTVNDRLDFQCGGATVLQLGFSSTQPRIKGDFSNATASSRVLFQTNVAGGTSVGAIPNTSGNSSFAVFGVPDADNSSYVALQWDGGSLKNIIRTGKTGAGTQRSLALRFNTTDCLEVDTDAPASTSSAALLLVNDGVVTSLRRISVGAADSGGAGFRLLRVPN